MKSTVIFRYSPLYDKILRKKNYGRKRTVILKPFEIVGYIKSVQKQWEKDEEKVLAELTRVTHLKWEERVIVCYVVGNSIPFPDPLTVPAYKNIPDYFVDILIHELIERLFLQPVNQEKMQKVWRHFYSKYKKEPRITKNHIPVHALFSHVMLKFFNKERLERERAWINYLSPYKRSWEIVSAVGYEEILKEFKSFT